MKIICPSCQQDHDDRYSQDSLWCKPCGEEWLETQDEDDIDLGETFG